MPAFHDDDDAPLIGVNGGNTSKSRTQGGMSTYEKMMLVLMSLAVSEMSMFAVLRTLSR